MKDKLRIIFGPYIIGLSALTVGYTFLHWLFIIELRLFSVKEVITNVVIPMILSAIVAWVILRPKLKILNLKTKKGSWIEFYSVLGWISLMIPMFIAQEYIITGTGKLSQLKSIDEISYVAPTKYYTLKSYYIDKSNSGTHSTFDVSGKYNSNFNMHIYMVMPIFESINDTTTNRPMAWLGVEYNKQISNKLDHEEKESIYQKFYRDSKANFERKNVSKFKYLDRIGNTDERDGYRIATRKTQKYEGGNTILVGINEPFEARNGKKLPWLLGSSIIGSLVFLIMILIPKIDTHHLNRIKAGNPDEVAQNEINEYLSFLKPREGFFVTLLLLYANLFIFLLMVISGLGITTFNSGDLIYWGANFGPYTRNGEWWRLISSTFLHGGIMHLLANMSGLLFAGIFLERLLGRYKFATAYFISGVAGSLLSIWWYEDTVSVGASGAIFGLYGVLLSFLFKKFYPPEITKTFIISILVFVAFNLVMGLSGGIDNAAHMGGLLGGFITGILMFPSIKAQAQKI